MSYLAVQRPTVKIDFCPSQGSPHPLVCSVVGRTLPFCQLVLPNWQLPGRLQRPWAEGGRTEAVYCSTRVPDGFSWCRNWPKGDRTPELIKIKIKVLPFHPKLAVLVAHAFNLFTWASFYETLEPILMVFL
jgi:hypothetical protein